jgi:hypothetical protein
MRGHGPKIEEAVQALRAAAELPANLRPSELERRIRLRLRAAGYGAAELPSRHAIARYFKFHLHSDQLAPIAQCPAERSSPSWVWCRTVGD